MAALARLRKLLSPPVFADEEVTRVAATVHLTGLAFAVIACASGVLIAVAMPPPALRLALIAAFLGALAVTLALLRRGYVRAGAWIFVVSAWLSLAGGMTVTLDPTLGPIAGFELPIAAAALVLGARASFAFALLSTLTVVLVERFELNFGAPPGTSRALPATSLWVHAFFFLGTAALVSIARGQAQRALARAKLSEARFRAIADYAQDMIFELDAEGRFRYANPKFLAARGLASVDQLAGEDVGYTAPAHDAALWRANIARLLETGESMRGTVGVTGPRGEPLEIETTAGVYDHPAGGRRVVLVSRDVTAQRAVEAALRDSEERYRSVAENAPDMIVEHDENRRVVYANRTTLEFLGTTLAELAEMSPADWTHPDDLPSVMRAFQEVMASERPVRLVHRMLKHDGSYVVMASSGAPFRTARGELHLIGLSRDLSHELSLQDQLRQSQKMEAIGRLAGGVAHDFNNLLTVIAGHTGVLDAALAPADPARESVREIADAAERAAALTRQLVALSSRQLAPRSQVELGAAIRGLVPVLRRTLPERIALELDLDGSLPPVEVDPSHVDQVLLNLVLNARDAMPAGGVLRIETRRSETGGVRLALSDTGVGMSPETLARAFEPFYTTKPAGAGSGLGLATTYGIVRQAGGAIALDSELGRGTRVAIDLPAATRPAPVQERAPLAAPPRRSRPAAILLVEDDASVRRLLALLLESSGHRVLAAADGREAMALTDDGRGKIDLLLTDYVLPAQSGAELCRVLRARQPGLRAVLMTGHAEVGSDGDELPDGVELISKPFSRDDLERTIAAQLAGA